MYKIKFIPTGHIFNLPDKTAIELKDKYPYEYKILEKNGKKFKDELSQKNTKLKNNSIRNLIVED